MQYNRTDYDESTDNVSETIPNSNASFLRRALYALDVFASVTICLTVFAAFKMLDLVLHTLSRHLLGRISFQLLKRYVILTVAFANIGLLAIVMALPIQLGLELNATSIILITAFLALILLLYRFVPEALEVPATLEEIRQLVQTHRLEKWVGAKMRNRLDTVWLRPLLVLLVLSIPAWLGLVTMGTINVWTVLWYAVVIVVASETVATFEHANGHYLFFRLSRRVKRSDRVIMGTLRFLFEHLLDLMLARIPHWYGVEHILVHHVEDNGPSDLQSTEPYDRASFIDFSRCANRFALSGMFPLDVIQYLVRSRRWKGLKSLIIGLCIFYVTLTLVGVWNIGALVVLLVLRYANLVMGSMTFFQEHGLIDVADPGNIYRNSLHYINEDNSHASLGEDPHIEHHLHPGRHWSEYIEAVEKDMNQYAAERAVGFLDGPGHIQEYYRLMWRGNFLKLAEMFVVFGQENASLQEVADILVSRTRPVTGVAMPVTMQRIDRHIGRLAGFLLS